MRNHLGINLVDSLISLFLFSLALIGIDSMLIHTTKQTESLYYLHVGMQQILQLHEQLLSSDNDTARVNSWNQQNQQILPDGYGELSAHKKSMLIFLGWKQGKQKECKYNDMDLHCLTIEMQRLKAIN